MKGDFLACIALQAREAINAVMKEIMSTQNVHTTMICLFHTPDQADAAVKELVQAGIAKESIGVMGNSGTAAANTVAMEKWKAASLSLFRQSLS